MRFRLLLLLALAGVVIYFLLPPDVDWSWPGSSPCPCPGPCPCPKPKIDPQPQPSPRPKPQPHRPRPWPNEKSPAVAGIDIPQYHSPIRRAGKIQLGGHVSPGGDEIQVDFPVKDLWFKNIGSKKDGAGMCVNTSIEQCFLYCGQADWKGFRDWSAQFSGGGWPERVDKQVPEYAKLKNLGEPRFLQYQGRDPAIIKLALKTGRPCAISYCGRDGVHYNQTISHFVVILHWSDREVGFLDNNVDSKIIWMNVHEATERVTGGRNIWAVIPLWSPPPLPPANARFKRLHFGGMKPLYTDKRPLPISAYSWRSQSPHHWLYIGKSMIGHFDDRDRHYREFRNGLWSTRMAPPVSPPGTKVPTGLVWSSIGNKEVYSTGGYALSRTQAFDLLEAESDLKDDTGQVHLTVIGSDEEIARVRRDWQNRPEFAPYRPIVHAHFWRPDYFAVRDGGFKTDGKPTIYLQRGRKVLHRADSYAGPKALAEALAKAHDLRRPDPNYDPRQDPNLNASPLLPLAGIAGDPKTLALIGLAIAGVFLLLWPARA